MSMEGYNAINFHTGLMHGVLHDEGFGNDDDTKCLIQFLSYTHEDNHTHIHTHTTDKCISCTAHDDYLLFIRWNIKNPHIHGPGNSYLSCARVKCM